MSYASESGRIRAGAAGARGDDIGGVSRRADGGGMSVSWSWRALLRCAPCRSVDRGLPQPCRRIGETPRAGFCCGAETAGSGRTGSPIVIKDQGVRRDATVLAGQYWPIRFAAQGIRIGRSLGMWTRIVVTLGRSGTSYGGGTGKTARQPRRNRYRPRWWRCRPTADRRRRHQRRARGNDFAVARFTNPAGQFDPLLRRRDGQDARQPRRRRGQRSPLRPRRSGHAAGRPRQG